MTHTTTRSGYTYCPCCGMDTVSADMSKPELCIICMESDCACDGSEPAGECLEDKLAEMGEN